MDQQARSARVDRKAPSDGGTQAGFAPQGLRQTAATLNSAPQVRQLATQPHPPARPGTSSAPVVQRYVTLGREMTDMWSNPLDVLGGETKKRLLTEEDIPQVLEVAIQELMDREERGKTGELTPESVSRAKNLSAHATVNRGALEKKLREWIRAPGELQSTALGVTPEAQWRQYDTPYELGLALAHETLPETQENIDRETLIAGQVNNSAWIADKLDELMQHADQYKDGLGMGRKLLETAESYMFGSYLHADIKGKPGKAMNKLLGTQTTGARITDNITALHDMMERWSSSQAGSIAASIHEKTGISTILRNPRDEAMNATMLDPDAELELGLDGEEPEIPLIRDLRRNTEEDRQRTEDAIVSKRLRKLTSRSKKSTLLASTGLMSEKSQQKQFNKRAQKLADSYGFSSHRDEDLKSGPTKPLLGLPELDPDEPGLRQRNTEPFTEKRVEPSFEKPREQPPQTGLAALLPNPLKGFFDTRRKEAKEAEDAKRKGSEPGKINKTSKAKGRKNVGTRDELDPDTLLSRLHSAPIWAGRSMTTARMMQLVEELGGDETHRTAVAYALFAYWRRTYNKGLTPVHTFHETMDVATNYGVPYTPFHYPLADMETGDINFANPQVRPMAGAPGTKQYAPGRLDGLEQEVADDLHEEPELFPSFSQSGLRRVNQPEQRIEPFQIPERRPLQAPLGKLKFD